MRDAQPGDGRRLLGSYARVDSNAASGLSVLRVNRRTPRLLAGGFSAGFLFVS